MGCCSEDSQNKPEEGEKPKNPLEARGRVCCTDIIILVLFIAFWGLMVYIAAYSIVRGDYRRILNGYDSFGNTCDQLSNAKIENLTHSGKNTKGKPYVLFMDMWDPLKSMQVCVSKCPDRDILQAADAHEFYRRTNSSVCVYDFDVAHAQKGDFQRTGPCPRLPIFQSAVKFHRCIPDQFGLFNRNSTNQVERNNLTRQILELIDVDEQFRKVISDFYACWRILICLCIIALVIASLMVILIRFAASFIVWIIVILAVVGSLVGTGFLWWTYVDIRALNQVSFIHFPILNVDVRNEAAFLAFSITASILTVILLLILLVLRKRIALVVALFHEAGKCLVDMPLLLIQPLWTFIILFCFFIYWAIIQTFISTIGTASVRKTFGFDSVQYVPDSFGQHFWWIHIINLIWTSEFILASQQYVIASAVATWYFTNDKSRLSCTLCAAVCQLALHHVGSVAFGSLIITIVKIPRLILMYIQKKCEASQNSCAQCCLKCCICCLWCLEKILKFINQNAYTIIAMEGSNFCTAAQKALSTITSNILRVAAVNSIGTFVLFLGKVGVMASTTTIAIFWLKTIQEVNYIAIPVILISFFSFLIAHCFLSVYEMVIDALLLCFCEDCRLNGGSPAFNVPLMDYVDGASTQVNQLKKSNAASQLKAEGVATELQPITT